MGGGELPVANLKQVDYEGQEVFTGRPHSIGGVHVVGLGRVFAARR
jgi:hypothetical protein